jgi:hypothetical protein
MSYDTIKYREILAQPEWEDTSDWIQRDHVPVWCRLDNRMSVNGKGRVSFLTLQTKNYWNFYDLAAHLNIGVPRLKELHKKYGWGYKNTTKDKNGRERHVVRISLEDGEKYRKVKDDL